MTYIACVNAPGCLPDTTEPLPTFSTTEEAWGYLADEWERQCDEAEVGDDVFLPVHTLMHTMGGSVGSISIPDPFNADSTTATGYTASVSLAEEDGG